MELQSKRCKAKAGPRPDFRRAADFTLVPSEFWIKFGDGVGAEKGSVLFEHVLFLFEFVFNIS